MDISKKPINSQMERQLHFSDLHSHPNKLLEEHLIRVASLVELFLNEKPLNIRKKLYKIAQITALCHDIGKSTRAFQEYLFAKEREQEKLRSEKTQHSLFSALCAYYISKETTDDEFLPFFSYVSVRRHHGDLISLLDEASLIDEKVLRLLELQVNDIDHEKFRILAFKLKKAGLPVLLNRELISQYINSFEDELRRIRRIIRKSSQIENYIFLNFLYSLLIDADKTEVSIDDFEVFKRKSLEDKDLVKYYVKRMQPKDTLMNRLRQKAFDEVNQKEISLDNRIFSINLPTGLGKTLTGFSFALKLRTKLQETGNTPRIIYSLPFISIIEQNSEILKKVITNNGFTVSSDILLKHHHLSDIYYTANNKDYETEESKLLIEGWNSEVIITTFIQLFGTLFTNRNSSLRKFHRLANSIIILDEIQSIPVKYWKIIREIIDTMCRILNSYVLVMTATEPYIFDNEQIKKLSEAKKYFHNLNRFEIISQIDNPIGLNELTKEVELTGDVRTLFIFNTINAARDFYNQIKELPISKTYLTTHIVPVERLRRIKEIKSGKYRIVVSTQIVEAGVDIDFNQVIRDIAPFDSIIQSAGRCNRNSKYQKGIVFIRKLIDSRNRTFASYVYDPVLLDVAEKLLNQNKIISEKNIFQLINDYFSQIMEKLSQLESENILEAVRKLRYDSESGGDTAISDFKLIEDDYPKIDVFVEYDEKAERVWSEFQRIKKIRNLFDRRKEFLKIRNDFYGYVISVPSKSENLPPVVENFYYVSKAQLKEYYDIETGFRIKGDTVIW